MTYAYFIPLKLVMMSDKLLEKFNELCASVKSIKSTCDRINGVLDGIMAEIAYIKKRRKKRSGSQRRIDT